MACAFVLVVSNQTVFLMLFILVLQLGRIVLDCLTLNLNCSELQPLFFNGGDKWTIQCSHYKEQVKY